MDTPIQWVRKEVASFLSIPPENVHAESRFIEDFGMDSLDMMELLISLEDRFDVVLSDPQMDDLSTVKDAARLVAEVAGESELPRSADEHDVRSYDEARWLDRYIFTFCGDSLTDLERSTHSYLVSREKEKANREIEEETARLTGQSYEPDEKDEVQITPQIEAALARGEDAFYRGVRDRLLSASNPDVDIKKCGECNRALATPAARQCFWCGAHWH